MYVRSSGTVPTQKVIIKMTGFPEDSSLLGWDPDKDNPADFNCHGMCGILDDPPASEVTERLRLTNFTGSTGMVSIPEAQRGPKSKKTDDMDTGKKIILTLERIEKNERAYKAEIFNMLCHRRLQMQHKQLAKQLQETAQHRSRH